MARPSAINNLRRSASREGPETGKETKCCHGFLPGL
jgi:hypothetical protein